VNLLIPHCCSNFDDMPLGAVLRFDVHAKGKTISQKYLVTTSGPVRTEAPETHWTEATIADVDTFTLT